MNQYLLTFADSEQKIALPIWQNQIGNSGADLQSFTKRGSSARIHDWLRGNRKVHIMHHADDFLAERKVFEGLNEALGNQVTVHQYGRHLGNLWFPERILIAVLAHTPLSVATLLAPFDPLGLFAQIS